MFDREGGHNNAAAPNYISSTTPPNAFERTHREVRDAPPNDPGGVLKRMLELACPDERRRMCLIYDSDAKAAKASNRNVALLKTTDLSPYLNEGRLPDGVEPLVAATLMQEVAPMFGVPDWGAFRQLVGNTSLSVLQAKRKVYEREQAAKARK